MKYGDVMGVEYGCRRSREGRLEEKEHGATVICCGGCTRICEGRRRGHLGRYNMKHGMTASKVPKPWSSPRSFSLSPAPWPFAGAVCSMSAPSTPSRCCQKANCFSYRQ
uniref:Uncharacterized protein n=1 Tax=Aegilops tauschii subsp. strangulata TaxID=200361 RepID=A0A453BSS1_AEGTS